MKKHNRLNRTAVNVSVATDMRPPLAARFIGYLTAVTVVLPLIYHTQMASLALSVRLFIFSVIVEIMVGLYVYLAICYPAYRPKMSILHWLVLGYGLVQTLAMFFGVDPLRSFWGFSNTKYDFGVLALWHYIAFFFVLSQVYKRFKEWLKLLRISLVVSTLIGIIALLQRFGAVTASSYPRVEGTLWVPNMYATYLLFHLAFSAILFFQSRKRVQRIVYGFIGLFHLLILFLTGTRGAVLALFVGVFFVLINWLVRSSESRFRFWARNGLVGVLAVMLIVVAFQHYLPLVDRFLNIGEAVYSNLGRLSAWRITLPALQTRPLLGYGPENYSVVLFDLFRPDVYGRRELAGHVVLDRPFNFITEQIVFSGLLGLALYLMIFIYGFYLLGQQKQTKAYPMLHVPLQALLIVYLVQNLFIYDVFTSMLLLMASLGLVSFLGLSPVNKEIAVLKKTYKNRRYLIAVPVAVVLILVVVSWNVWRGFGRIAAVSYFEVKAHIIAVREDRKAKEQPLNMRPIGSGYNKVTALARQNPVVGTDVRYRAIYELLLRYPDSISRRNINNISSEDYFGGLIKARAKSELFDPHPELLELARKNLSLEPTWVRNYIALADVISSYLQYGQISSASAQALHEEARAALEKAKELAPQYQEVYYKQALLRIQHGEFEQGERILQEAVALAPDTPLSYWKLALLYIAQHQDEKAIKAFRMAMERNFVFNQSDSEVVRIFIQKMYEHNQYQEVVSTTERLINVKPAPIWFLWQALAFEKLGRHDEAVDAANEAVETNQELLPILYPIYQVK